MASADINQVKSDVLPFVKNPKELNIWSNDYFLQLADMIRFEWTTLYKRSNIIKTPSAEAYDVAFYQRSLNLSIRISPRISHRLKASESVSSNYCIFFTGWPCRSEHPSSDEEWCCISPEDIPCRRKRSSWTGKNLWIQMESSLSMRYWENKEIYWNMDWRGE